MTREEAMLKLLALEPERQDRLVQICGWGESDTLDVLAALKAAGRIRTIATLSVAGGHRTWFIPGVHDEAIQRVQHDRDVRKEREKRGAAGRRVANTRRKASTRGESRAL